MKLFVSSLLLLLLLPLASCHSNTRFKSSNYKLSSDWPVRYFDSVGGCAAHCSLNTCEAFATKYHIEGSPIKHRAFECVISKDASYSNNKVSDSNWRLWEKKTTTSSARSTASVTAGTEPSECPIVWRSWTSTNSTLAWEATMSSQDGDMAASAVLDGLTGAEDPLARTKTDHSYPFISIDLQRTFRVTKVSILGGDDIALNPLMNLEVRVGGHNKAEMDHNANTKITENTRCGVFYGPALVASQWVEIDCGYRKGITGRYLSIQLLDRSIPAGGGKMEIREVEIEGWARSCGSPCLQTSAATPENIRGRVGSGAVSEWYRVRHVNKRSQWHPAYDNLKGSQSSYGNSADDSQPWSVKWSSRDYDEIMLATGDWQHWLIVDKDELIGSSGTKYYSNQPVRIKASSEQCDPYYANMYRRNGVNEDPWISLRNYGPDPAKALIVYGGYNHGSNTQLLNSDHGGLDVYVRRKPAN